MFLYNIKIFVFQIKRNKNFCSPNFNGTKIFVPYFMKIHFIGICGVAMSALAIAMQKQGHKITGSDKGFYPPISDHLRKYKINFYPGWHIDKMCTKGDPDLVVVGNVAGSENPEWQYCQKNKLNYLSYPELIQKYFLKDKSIVCAGTYGKTSITALLSWIFLDNDLDPSYMFGGLVVNNMDAADLGQGKYSILEGDEYKIARWDPRPKFTLYDPSHLILTAVEWDHADLYPREEDYLEVFENLISRLPENGLLVVNTDNANAQKISQNCQCRKITYGKNNAQYIYENISQNKNGLEFEIIRKEKKYKIKSNLIGAYMAENITASFIMARELQIPPEKIIEAIEKFRGIKRRLEKRYEDEVTIIDDIAHSPVKAKSALANLRKIYNGKIIAVFEPNTGNRYANLIKSYDHAFSGADLVIIPRLTKIKKDLKPKEKLVRRNLENQDEGRILDGEEISKIISRTHKNVKYISDDTKLIQKLIKATKKDDLIVFLGSHGFLGMIEEVIEKIN